MVYWMEDKVVVKKKIKTATRFYSENHKLKFTPNTLERLLAETNFKLNPVSFHPLPDKKRLSIISTYLKQS